MKAVKKAIMRYVDAFNLRGSTSRILKTLKDFPLGNTKSFMKKLEENL